ncbi:MAG TPA: tetratricopeptide repeat-containing sensor histidine kinase [Sphingobacteriaceae bacterium]
MRIFILVLFLLKFSEAFAQAEKNSLLKKLRSARPDTAKVDLYLGLSRLYQESRPDSAIQYARLGLELSRGLNYRLGEAMLTSQLGTINEIHDNIDVARKFNLQALAFYKQLNHTKGIAAEYNGLGILEGKNGNFDAATRYFLKALKLNEKARYKQGIVQSYIKLGLVNELSGELDKALTYYLNARKLNGSDAPGLYYLLNNIGTVEARKGNLREALKHFEEGIAKSDSVAYGSIHVSLRMNAANALDQLGRKQEALVRYKAVLGKTRQYNLPEAEARVLLNLSGLERRKADQYLESALDIAGRIGNTKLEAEIYQEIADHHKQEKRFEKALAALETHHRLVDSILSKAKTREIASLQASYELDKSQEEVKTLELSNQKRTAERNVIIVGTICVLLGCLTLWLYLLKFRRLNQKLAKSNEVKDKLFSIIGHDLRSPVGGIVQMMEVMESGLLSEAETKEMLSGLRKHSEASLETLDSLLLWGKSQLQGISVRKTSFESKPLIQKNLAFFNRQAEQKLIVIKDQTPHGLTLYADRDHFDFVMRNLLSNAVKFSHPSGIIKVSVSTRQQPDLAIFSVSDEGKGIKEELAGQLFQPVSSDDGTAGEKGTGLGLVLCKEFMQASGGDIWVESKEGNGSVFYFSLPYIEQKHTRCENRLIENSEAVA